MGALKQRSVKPVAGSIPIGESVRGFYLKKTKYLEGYKVAGDKSTAFQKLVFHFLWNDKQWMSLHVYNPRRANFDTEFDFDREKLRVDEIISNILKTFLPAKEMKRLIIDSKGFRSWANNIKDSLKKHQSWKVPLEVKTVPSKTSDGTFFPRYANFIRREGDRNIRLKYTNYEKKLIGIED